ncbi:hypothetical protein VK792_11065 [Mesobacterium sp. TK19101]|uniref:Uncharacterized protein n=1 Tax=Mesobacterium hydrothermale TaxID=3111907 RepID=A0ABU6HHI5_9RHOB|nr:hypothetical protein [Mesobacterium sp. TK19101]MEC3861826.1 hypothetical protein [Mesobacterium sp. TK19101]
MTDHDRALVLERRWHAPRAVAMHNQAEAKKHHAAMGFRDGWGAAATQPEALAKTL